MSFVVISGHRGPAATPDLCWVWPGPEAAVCLSAAALCQLLPQRVCWGPGQSGEAEPVGGRGGRLLVFIPVSALTPPPPAV